MEHFTEPPEQKLRAALDEANADLAARREQAEQHLDAGESESLAALERTIEVGLRKFVEVGRALAAIRDRRLYRETHRRFQDYIEHRWGLSRARAYQLIGAADVADRVSTNVGAAPTNEAQARELGRLPEDQQLACWSDYCEACAEAGRKPTAAGLRGKVDTWLAADEPYVEPDDNAGGTAEPVDVESRVEMAVDLLDVDFARSHARAVIAQIENIPSEHRGLVMEIVEAWIHAERERIRK